MWSICSDGFVEEGPVVDTYRNGGANVEYEAYAKNYSFNNVEEFQAYQQCMVNSLSLSQIRDMAAAPAAVLR